MHHLVSLLLFILVFGSPIWIFLIFWLICRTGDGIYLQSQKKKMVESGWWKEEDIKIIGDKMYTRQ